MKGCAMRRITAIAVFAIVLVVSIGAARAAELVGVLTALTSVEALMTETAGELSRETGMMPDFSDPQDLQVDGDKATATMGGRPIKFVRSDGRWYVRLEL